MMGNLSRFEDLSELKTALTACIESIRDDYENRAEQDEEKSQLESKLERSEQALQEALALSKEFGMRTILEQTIAGDPRASKMRQLFEEYTFDTPEQIKEMVSAFCRSNPLSEEFSVVSAQLSHGSSYLVEESGTDEEYPEYEDEDEGICGVSVDELVDIAGI